MAGLRDGDDGGEVGVVGHQGELVVPLQLQDGSVGVGVAHAQVLGADLAPLLFLAHFVHDSVSLAISIDDAQKFSEGG